MGYISHCVTGGYIGFLHHKACLGPFILQCCRSWIAVEGQVPFTLFGGPKQYVLTLPHKKERVGAVK